MKRLLRMFVISTVSLYAVSQFFPQGLVWDHSLLTLAQAGIGLTIANVIVKPLFSLMLLPLNLLTFGMFRWVTNVALLYLVVHFVSGIQVQAFTIQEFTYSGLVIPQINLNHLTAWIAVSFFLSVISGLLIWLVRK